MDHSQKAKFILALHKHSLQAFDDGGTVLGGTSPGGVNQNAVNPNTGFAGTIGNFLGINNQFQASGANVQGGTNTAQLNAAYSGAQSGLNAQQAFAGQAAGQGGFGNQSNVFSQQQALANQLQNQANGQGPNPAQAALNQSTGQNIQNQAALMAGQRGASSNAGLAARQAAQQGAATQQQAVGQGATMQAQQQIAAQSALANQQAQMQNVAANEIAAQGQGANNFSQAQQSEQNILQGANTAANNAAVTSQGNINNVNAQTAASNQNMAGQTIAGVGQMLSNIPVVGSLFKAKGGMIKKMAGGGDATSPQYPSAMFANGGGVAPPPLASPGGGPQSFAGQWLNSNVSASPGPSIAAPSANPQFIPPQKKDKSSSGPQTPKPPEPPKPPGSAGDDDASPEMIEEATSGGVMEDAGAGALSGGAAGAGDLGTLAALAAKGGRVKAHNKKEKAKVKDNSYANDKVPALLSEGEIVIPRSITTHPMAPHMAAQFVQAVLNKRKMGRASA